MPVFTLKSLLRLPPYLQGLLWTASAKGCHHIFTGDTEHNVQFSVPDGAAVRIAGKLPAKEDGRAQVFRCDAALFAPLLCVICHANLHEFPFCVHGQLCLTQGNGISGMVLLRRLATNFHGFTLKKAHAKPTGVALRAFLVVCNFPPYRVCILLPSTGATLKSFPSINGIGGVKLPQRHVRFV